MFPRRDGWREGGPMRGLGTDHMISGTMRGLKKTALNGANGRTHGRTWRLYDWIGPVGPIQWKLQRKGTSVMTYRKKLWPGWFLENLQDKSLTCYFINRRVHQPASSPAGQFTRWTDYIKDDSHNCFMPLSFLVLGLLSTGLTTSSFHLLVEMGLPLHLFPAYRWWELVQLFIKRHHQKCLKWTKLCLGPI